VQYAPHVDIHLVDKMTYVIGTHSTGKTTLSAYIAAKYDKKLLTETAREIIRESDKTLAEIRLDLKDNEEFQKKIYDRQANKELNNSNFVSDRSIIDTIIYSAACNISPWDLIDERFYELVPKMNEHEIFYLRPHKSLVKDDGVRNTNWDWIMRIDGMFHFLVNYYRLDVIEIRTPDFGRRIDIVNQHLG